MRAIFIFLAASLAFGCSGGGTTDVSPPPAPVVSVAIFPGNVVLSGPGASSALTAQVATSAGIVSNPAVTWTSDNPGIATVVGSGGAATVTSVSAGTTTIRATSSGVTGTTAVLVHPPASLAVVASPLSVAQGATGSTNVVVTRTNYSGALSLTIDPLPTGISAAVTSSPIVTGTIEAHTVTFTVIAAVATGTYPVTVRAAGAGVAAVSFTFNLTVIAGAAATNTFHGTWTGSGVQSSPAVTWTVLLSYAGGPIGSVVATVAYPSLSCGGTWTLNSMNADSLRVRETITFGGCIDSDYTVRITPPGELDFNGTAVAYPVNISGRLTRASASSGPSLGSFAAMWRALRLPVGSTAEQTIDIGLVDGPVGAVVGSLAYPGLLCGGRLRLARVTATEIDVVEEMTYGSCPSGDTLTISRNGTPAAGMMLRWHRTGVAGAANLYSSALPSAPVEPGSPSTAVAPGQVTVAWTDRSNTEAGFVVERSEGAAAFTVIGVVGAGVAGYVDSTVASARTYNYRIRALNARGWALSSTVTATTQ